MSDFYKEPTDLKGVSSEMPEKVTLIQPLSLEKVVINTQYGPLTVHVQPATEESYLNIITYHEVGLAPVSTWDGLLKHPDASALLRKATFYHICAPGQGANEPNMEIPAAGYPTMDHLAMQVGSVVDHFKMNRFVGMGAGAGANILTRYAFDNQQTCSGLLLMSPLLGQSGWLEWGFKKVSDVQLAFSSGLPHFILDNLIATYFGVKTINENVDLVNVVKTHMTQELNPHNFGYFLQAYADRTSLFDTIQKKNFRVQVLMITGGNTNHTDEVVNAIPCFQVDKLSHLELFHCGDMCQLERPDEVLRAFILFLAGMGMII